jgi:hypothetical protein
MPRLRLAAERQLGDDRSVPAQRVVEAAVFFGIDNVDAAGDDCGGAGFERSQMRRSVDAARQPRDDDEPAPAETGGESRASRLPLAEALRAPTIATIGRSSHSR